MSTSADEPVLPRLPDDALVLMAGAAASGKSTVAARFAEGVVATDEFRRLLGESERDISVSDEAFDMVAEVVDTRMRRGLFTVVDSTALERLVRWGAVSDGLRTWAAGDTREKAIRDALK